MGKLTEDESYLGLLVQICFDVDSESGDNNIAMITIFFHS